MSFNYLKKSSVEIELLEHIIKRQNADTPMQHEGG